MKKVIFLLIFVISIFSIISFSALAFDDMPSDWSTTALQSAVDNGLLTGDGNLLKPRDTLTRAQMAAIITRAFGAVNEADLSEFSDVPENAWYRDEVAKAYYMNVFRGDGAGRMNPDNPVTREEAFVVIARALYLDENASSDVLSKFDDADKVSDWAKGAISSMVSNFYVNGSNGKINPRGNITRAEFAQLMYNVISLYVDDASDLDKMSDTNGNVVIRANVGAISECSCQRDLIIADGVEGKLVINNVNVGSRIVIRGNVDLAYKGVVSEIVAVSKNVSVTLEKGAEVDKLTLPEGATLTDKSKETETPTAPVTPSNPVTPPSDSDDDKDIWTNFH